MRTITVEVTALNSIVPIPAFVPPANTVPAPVPGGSAPSNESTFGGATNQTPSDSQSTTVTESGAQASFASMSLQAGGTTFSTGNQTTNVPITNPNILWGAAAAATLGATLAEWQKKREEEAARLAALIASNAGQGDEDEIPPDVLAKRRGKVIAKNQAKRTQEQAWETARVQQQAKPANKLAKIDTDEERLEAYKQTAGYQSRQQSYAKYYAEKIKNRINVNGNKQLLKPTSQDEKPPDNRLLACTADNPYGLPIFYPKQQTSLDWLIDLYKHVDLPGNTLFERTRYVLNATQNGYRVHFNEHIPIGDSGFAPTFQDEKKWPSSGNQVGHFLTAVDLSMKANDPNVPPIFRQVRQQFALNAIIGHELIGDNVGTFRPVVNALQIYTGFAYNLVTFGAINRWFLSGEEENFQKIISFQPQIFGKTITPLTSGNSMEDLRLSYQGWVAGEQITNGSIINNEGFAQWLEKNLK